MYQVTTRQFSPFQVEFPKTKKVDGKKESVEFERTKKGHGSRHFRPGSVAYLTADEYGFLKADKNLRSKFLFQGEVKEQKAKPIEPVAKSVLPSKPQNLKRSKNKS